MKTYYYLYRITNNLNNKIYVGVHKTADLNDSYMGSGKIIVSAINKYGIDNFKKDIIEYFNTAEEMFIREKEIVNDEFLLREDVYNIRRGGSGGSGGFDYINKNIELRKEKNKTARQSTISVQDARLNKTVQITADEFLQPTPSPTIIIGHGCDGPASIKFFVSTVQSWGYNVVVPDSFGGRGVFETCGKTWVNRHQRRMDIEATSEWIMKQPWHKGKIGYMGFSHGGAGGLEYSNAPGTSLVSAVVAYYPWCAIPNYTAKIPTQIHVGSKDDWTGDDCSKLQGADVKVYPGVYHSFIYPKSYRVYVGHALAYDEQADRLAKEASQLFFKQHLKD